MLRILSARGFGQRWIKKLLVSSSSRVMIDGKLGSKITSGSGLRQGDALPPYLFILVADVLQRLCIAEYSRGNLRHPLSVDCFFHVLQYTDLPIQGNFEQAQITKRVLCASSDYTGLQINFSKSTFIPICMDDTTSQMVSGLLQCF